MSQLEKENREEEEVIRVVDSPSAERAIEILNRGIAFQDWVVNGLLEGFDYKCTQRVIESEVEDTIVVRAIHPDRSMADGFWGTSWILTTPRSKRRLVLLGTPAEQLAGLERSSMEGIKEEEEGISDNKRKEGTQATIEWADELEIPDSMETGDTGIDRMSEEKEKKDLELKRWAEVNPLTIKFEPAGKQVEEMAKEKVEGARESVDKGKEEMKGDNEDMGEEEEDGKKERGRWNGIWDNRDLKLILHCMVNNGRILEQIAELKPRKRSHRLARDVDMARDIIRVSGGVIEGNWWLDGDEYGKRGWKVLSARALGEGNLEFIKLVTEAERTWRTNQEKGRIEEEKRKQEEVKKVKHQRKEVEARRKEEEKNKEEAKKLTAQSRSVRESQKKARKACEDSIRELVGKDKLRMKAHELIEIGQKLKEAEEMKRKVEKELASLLESMVGRTRQVVAGEVYKMVKVVMGHMQPIDSKRRIELEGVVGKVNNMLRMKGLAEGKIP
ncbi:hypothetical protein L211DRAFT_853534 [Terfezia boudieri ATCC MYA-4762]|uniref:Uncharacterized protein n=1 Tax=Terfezia boudieri ATCC MYA-4762 TaxID=1051890 RepID=A0A3N4L886_9PEZI|nr:hypothetical protein L211DRAFT_853534 [Terfezia boudieri ATCC MYA-4762]